MGVFEIPSEVALEGLQVEKDSTSLDRLKSSNPPYGPEQNTPRIHHIPSTVRRVAGRQGRRAPVGCVDLGLHGLGYRWHRQWRPGRPSGPAAIGQTRPDSARPGGLGAGGVIQCRSVWLLDGAYMNLGPPVRNPRTWNMTL